MTNRPAPLPPIAELRAWVTDQVNLNSWITMPGDVVLALLDRVEALERVAQAARAVARQDVPEPDDAEAWPAFDTQRVERMVALSFALSALDGDQ